MDQDERRRLGMARTPVDEVDLEPVDGREELGKLIELPLLLAPIEGGSPVIDELFQIGEVGPIIPSRALDLARVPCSREPFFEVPQNRLRNVDAVRHDVARGLGWRRGSHRDDEETKSDTRVPHFQPPFTRYIYPPCGNTR